MRIEPIDQGFWLRLLDVRPWSTTRAKRTCSNGALLSKSPTRTQSSSVTASKQDSEPLPQELWEAVFGVVSPSALLAFRAACSHFRERLDDPSAEPLWEAAYLSEWRGKGVPSGAADLWRLKFLARWWAHGRWGVQVPTILTLMGKKAHGGTVTCVALGECGVDSGEGLAVSASDESSLFLWRFACEGNRPRAGSPGAVAQQHHLQSRGADVRCPQRSKQFHGHAGPVWCLWFNQDQDRLLSGGYDATVKLWSLSNERCEATLRGHDGWVRSLEVMQAGRTVVSGGSDGVLKIWNLESLQCLNTTEAPNGDPRHSTECLASTDESRMLVSGHSGMRHLLHWDIETCQHTESFKSHEDDIYAVHAHGPSSLLVSGSKDRTVRVWDTRMPSDRCITTLRSHTGAVLDLKLRGNRVVSASMDKTLRMWDIREPSSPLATLEGHSAEVHSVDFRDRMVLSGSRDTSLKVWTVV